MYQLLWIVLQAASSAAIPVNHSPELRVVTSSGIVNGIYNNTAQTVRGFIGIPYAEPPVGRLRFAPPQSKPPARHPIDVSSFSDPCPQVYTYSNESIWSILPYKIWNSANMSEDCLYINIWTPSSKHQIKRARNAAVMMFIHGGGYGSGSGSVAFYDGTNLVRDNEDIIVVTFK
jgi:carboxylesterase type B